MSKALVSRRYVLAAVSALCVWAAGLAVVSAPALALSTHVFSSSFGSSGSGAGQVSSPNGVAVNSTTHDVYVADTGNARVDQFDSSGTFIRAWGYGVADGITTAFQSCTLTCFAGLPGSGAGQFTSPAFVAVDNSGGASSGDVYVGDTGTNLVSKFSSVGVLVGAWGSGGQLNGSTATSPVAGPFGPLAGVAVDSGGKLYVFDTNSDMFEFAQDGSFATDFNVVRGTGPAGLAVNAAGDFFKVNGDGSVERVTAANSDVGQVSASTATGGVAIDPADGDLYVDATAGAVEHYAFDGSGNVLEPGSPACTPASFSGCAASDSFGSGHISNAAGLAVGANHTVYAADAGNARIDVFTGPVVIPDVSTNPVSALRPITATLNGHLDPAGGGNVTGCHFEYVTDAAFSVSGYSNLSSGGSVPCAEGSSFSVAADVHANVSSLTAETTYHYRLVASNASGENSGSDQVFTTPPTVTLSTGLPTAVGPASATLNANVDPAGNGSITDCHFQYIDDTTFSSNGGSYSSGATSIACDQLTPISPAMAVTAHLTGLTAETIYHFRISATNADGTSVGSDQTFTTLVAVNGVSTDAASNVGRTSATLNGSLDPNGSGATYHFQWGTDTSYGHSAPVPDADAGSGVGSVPASTDLIGLQPATVYHFRLVATSGFGTTVGPDRSFVTTVGPGLATLPATNLQSTSATLNGILNPSGQPITDCHFDYGTDAGYGHSAPCSPAPGSGSGAVAVHADLIGLADGTTYFFRLVATNADGTTAGALTLLTTPSSPVPSTCPNAALRTGPSAHLPDCRAYELVTPADKRAASQDLIFASGGFGQSAVPSLDGNRIALVADGVAFGPNPQSSGSFSVFSRTASGWGITSVNPPGSGGDVYNSNALFNPDLTQVAVRSESFPSPPPSDNFAAGPVGGPYSAFATMPFGSDTYLAAGASNLSSVFLVSTDHTLLPGGSPTGTLAGHDIYQSSGGRLSLVNVTTGGSLVSPCGAYFPWASNDGSRVFFVSPDPTASGDPSCNQPTRLYLRLNGSKTVQVSPGSERVTSLSGSIEGAAADGSKVFFVTSPDNFNEKLYEYDTATETLTPIASNVAYLLTTVSADGSAVYYRSDTTSSYYRYDTTDGTTHFVATAGLSNNGEGAQATQPIPNLGGENATTPDGRFFIFRSDSLNGAPVGPDELYRYDAADSSLTCVSCPPNNAPAAGGATFQNAFLETINRTPRFVSISNDGSYVFFNTNDHLVPQDTNSCAGCQNNVTPATDVYEWHNGVVSLISTGNDPKASVFLGASTDGRDVFFGTHSQLVPSDTDFSGDIYDARIGGGFPVPAGSAPCEGDACHNPPPAPNDATPSTSTFPGPGNLAPAVTKPKAKVKAKRCGEGRVLRKGRCVKKKAKKKKKRAARRAVKHNRGGSK